MSDLSKKSSSLKRGQRVLSSAGLRATGQRALILKIIRRGQGHLDADEIYRQARQKEPRLSLSTVYRNLHKFKEQGLVDELHFDEGHHHYEVRSAAEHLHLVCLGCGRIVESTSPLPHRVFREVARANRFKVTEAEIRLSGYCPDCQQDRG